MTKNEIEQVYYLTRELKMWEKELERIRKSSYINSPPLSEAHVSGASDKTAARAVKEVFAERQIESLKIKIQKSKDEALAFIGQIPDSLTRMIVYCRCVKLMSWRKIAAKVGGNNSEASVKMLYYRFFEKK